MVLLSLSPMAALDASAFTISTYSFSAPSFSPSSSTSSPRFLFSAKTSLPIKLNCCFSAPVLSFKSHISSCLPLLSNKKTLFKLYSAVEEETTVEENREETQQEQRKKLYVSNLSWTLSVADIKKLFGECGTVVDVEIIKEKDGRNKGFAFVTMASGEEACAVIDKFNSSELSGRTLRLDFAKRLKKPSPPPPEGALPRETRHKIYVSNLAWKARASHLREFFSATPNLVSARVVFDNLAGRSAGYGFVSFATREDAESAISALDGKELLGRPVRLKFGTKNADESGGESKAASVEDRQLEENDSVSDGQPEQP